MQDSKKIALPTSAPEQKSAKDLTSEIPDIGDVLEAKPQAPEQEPFKSMFWFSMKPFSMKEMIGDIIIEAPAPMHYSDNKQGRVCGICGIPGCPLAGVP